MKKGFIVLVSLMLLLTAASAAMAMDTPDTINTRGEAMTSITVSMEDPEVSAWVVENFKSEKAFMKALDRVDDDKVTEVAQAFSDFQAGGTGAMDNLSMDAPVWAWVAILVLIIILI